MKRLFLALTGLALTASASGCCCDWCNWCNPCRPACGPCGTGCAVPYGGPPATSYLGAPLTTTAAMPTTYYGAPVATAAVVPLEPLPTW